MSLVTTTNTAAPPLPADLEALMRSLKMPQARAPAPELIATACAQRWEPAEVIKALFTEEAAGRARSMLASRRKAAGFPTGKPSTPGTPRRPPSGPRPSRRCGTWNGSLAGKTWSSAVPLAPGKRSSSSKHSPNRPSKPGCGWRGSDSRTSAYHAALSGSSQPRQCQLSGAVCLSAHQSPLQVGGGRKRPCWDRLLRSGGPSRAAW
jgi:hypothetical protein